jgi:hypothetical protein
MAPQCPSVVVNESAMRIARDELPAMQCAGILPGEPAEAAGSYFASLPRRLRVRGLATLISSLSSLSASSSGIGRNTKTPYKS